MTLDLDEAKDYGKLMKARILKVWREDCAQK